VSHLMVNYWGDTHVGAYKISFVYIVWNYIYLFIGHIKWWQHWQVQVKSSPYITLKYNIQNIHMQLLYWNIQKINEIANIM